MFLVGWRLRAATAYHADMGSSNKRRNTEDIGVDCINLECKVAMGPDFSRWFCFP